MHIRNLEHSSFKEIYQCFTDAFANYVIPLQFDEAMTRERWNLADVDYRLSYGAFDGDHLVGFILNIKINDELFNFGTGVIATHRGQRIVEKLYQKITEEQNFKIYSLEVIKQNSKALRIYQALGFTIKRDLISLQGTININNQVKKGFKYKVLPLNTTQEQETLRLYQPSIENSMEILMRHRENYELHELRVDQKLLAYVVYQPKLGSIKEIGALHPIDENLDQLMLEMKMNGEKLRVMNIDATASELISYFCDRDVNIFVSQYEMVKKL